MRRQSSPSRSTPQQARGTREEIWQAEGEKGNTEFKKKTKVLQGWFRISAPPESEDRSEVEPKNEERQSMGLPPRKKGNKKKRKKEKKRESSQLDCKQDQEAGSLVFFFFQPQKLPQSKD